MHLKILALLLLPPFLWDSNFNFNPVPFPLRLLRATDIPLLCIGMDCAINSQKESKFSDIVAILSGPFIHCVPELLLSHLRCERSIWPTDLRTQTKNIHSCLALHTRHYDFSGSDL